MGTTAAPRIDDRLRRFIAGSDEPAAEVTRLVGAFAEDLDLSRPSYQQVRVLRNAARSSSVVRPVFLSQTDTRLVDLLAHLYDYPGLDALRTGIGATSAGACNRLLLAPVRSAFLEERLQALLAFGARSLRRDAARRLFRRVRLACEFFGGPCGCRAG